MTVKQLFVNLGKLIACGAVFELGTILGGMLATLLGLPLPVLPQGVDMSTVQMYSMLATPLLALALAVIAVGLGGNWLTRTLILALFIWVTYTLNTQLEASIFSTYATGIAFALVTYAVPAILCGAVVACLFSPANRETNFFTGAREFFARRAPLAWAWRFGLAAIAFMPIYFVFGLMVVPFTADYYRQSMFGLAMPTIEQILPILFVRSVLFLLACLPIFILWQKSDVSLLWRLGLALFLLVGFVFMLTSTWLPPYVRIPHMLEILADEFVYAGALVLLLGKGELLVRNSSRLMPRKLAP